MRCGPTADRALARSVGATALAAFAMAAPAPAQATVTEFAVPTSGSRPYAIVAGPDGNLWFTEEDVNQVASITPQGGIQEFLPGGCCFPTGIAPAVDGNVWYTIEIGDLIGRIDAFGQTTVFQVPSQQILPWDITPGPDGNVWFSELAGRAIGPITPSGDIVEYPIPGPFSGIAGLTAGPDGNIWYTENGTDHVGSIDTGGNVLPTYDTAPGSRPLSIATGPDGNLWFTEADANAIGRVNVAPSDGAFALSMDAGFSPSLARVPLGGTMKWMFVGPRLHSVRDASGFGLFDSGPQPMVSYYARRFTAAGTYQYKDGVGSSRGAQEAWVTVPVSLQASAGVNQPFPVTWSTTPPAAGIVFDVQVAMPTALAFLPWQTSSQAAGSYVATNAGTYRFRARMRDTASGATASYSQPASITVR